MYSLTVPLPGRVHELAHELRPALQPFERVREEHSLLLKRLGDENTDAATLGRQVHRALEGAPAFEVRITGIETFSDPPLGPAPVLYLAVESPGLEQLHDRLCDTFEPVEGLEGPAYVPHVTLARGGPAEATERLQDRDIEAITWTVSELAFAEGTYRQPISRISLPA